MTIRKSAHPRVDAAIPGSGGRGIRTESTALRRDLRAARRVDRLRVLAPAFAAAVLVAGVLAALAWYVVPLLAS